jgi:hypothetical protein
MKLKSLLFGSAAILAAGTGAQAADLPVAEPVEFVRICDAFGTGYYFIPGTDTCLRISGRVRVEAHYVDEFDDDDDDDDDDDGGRFDDFFGVDRETNNFTTRARGNVRLDARTQTDLGLVRAFIEYQVQVGHGGLDSNATNYSSAAVDLSSAFIQISNDFGSFTAGHTASFFDFWGSNTFGSRVGIDDNTTEQTLFAFTAGFGNGFSATVSLEDPASSGRRLNPGAGALTTVLVDDDGLAGTPPVAVSAISGDNYEGQEWPDLVGNIRLDQGWGSAQLMGVLHHIHDKEGFDAPGVGTVLVDPDGAGPLLPVLVPVVTAPGEGEPDADDLGWAVGAGANIGFGMFGFNSQIGYADGALGYITTDPGGAGDWVPDGSGEPDTNQAWMVRAGLTAEWTPTISSSLDASYTDVDSDADVLDYNFWAVAANVVWEPVPGLIMGPEIAYNNIDGDSDDDDDDDFDDDDDDDGDDVWSVMFRIQRDF